MSNNGRNSPQTWRPTAGTSSNKANEGSDRIAGQVHVQPIHHHHHQQQHQHKERIDRDRDKNHETVCNLLSMLTLGMDPEQEASTSGGGGSTATLDHTRMLLLNLTNSPESCIALRRAGCIPLLIDILHPPPSPPLGMKPPEIIKTRAARALKNIVQFNPDEKLKRKELRVLKLLEGIRAFSEAVRLALQALGKDIKSYNIGCEGNVAVTEMEDPKLDDPSIQDKLRQTQQHPTANMTTLMKLSFDEEHRNIMCLLGAIHALADLIVCDHLVHGNSPSGIKDDCLLIRRYSGMTLTNLTFGDGTNKALLCGMRDFMQALVSQLDCENEDVCQVTASVLRNLSWHADSTSRASLRDSNAVPKLTLAAIKSSKESTLKATLSALWNLSAHSVSNKGAICTASPEAMPFLISLLRPNNPILKTLKTPMTIIENAGGILRNVSSQISSSQELRKILRDNHCYEILLEHLKSCSLTVVSNACGTLWNLSGGVGCEEDQRKLLDLNAVPMLKNLIYSKHERISQGASAALRNLLSSRFAKEHMLQLDSRLTAQIYSPNPANIADRGNACVDSNQESPGSDGDFDFEFNGHVHHPHSPYQQQQQQQPIIHHHPNVHQEPPLAHQHSSAAAASIFHRIHVQPAHTVPAPTHFHSQANFAHPGNYMNRPTSINYSIEPEPLDLTLTSAKSSPIHIISAAEFGGMTGHHQHLHHSHPHHRKPKPSPFAHSNQCHNNPKPFYNPPSLLHQTGSASQCNSPMRFAYPGAKFNQSCPEILSRLNSGHPQINNFVSETKPLDFSSNSPSASSSLRGAGETAGAHNDSANGGDTTFNYSLQYTEEDDEYRVANARSGESAAKSEDTLKTYCYEGTPHNFSISNSCQDLVQEIEFEKSNPSAAPTERPSANNANKSPKLQPIDEAPKSYYVENTPAVFSRTSSLSSINSSGGLNAGENKAEPLGVECQSPQASAEKKAECVDESPSSGFHHAQNKRRTTSQGILAPGRVTFSAEETPLMFSRCSSVASLDSLDVGVVGSGGGKGLALQNDDDLSDFSRRASEVVSPSDLPDSPRAMTPPVRLYEQPIHGRDKIDAPEKQEGDDDIKVFSVEEKSGLNSCRSLSPLMIDDEVLPILSKRKLEPEQGSLEKRGTATATSDKAVVRPIPSNESQLAANGNSEEKLQDGHGKKKAAFPDDEVKIFAMEGTPFYGVSNATSLSDLTMDLDNGEQKSELQQCKAVEEASAVQIKPVDVIVATEPASHPKIPLNPISCENNGKSEEPIYSDVQLLQKCIRIGKTVGIPKSKSEYKITNEHTGILAIASSVSSSSSNLTSLTGPNFKKTLVESKSQQDFDDPDLAALIMKGRNRPKEKERTSSKGSKPLKKSDKEDMNKGSKSSSQLDPSNQSSDQRSDDQEQINPKPEIDVSAAENKVPTDDEKSCDSNEINPSEVSKPDNVVINKTELKIDTLQLDPSQISTTSLGSEWNDETPTFSSPIPSMSISTAFKIVGDGDDSSSSKPPAVNKAANKIQSSMNSSMLTMSVNNELLDNIDPPSTFSNLVSSSDCILMGSPPLNNKLQGSMSDKLSRKWKALEAGNTSSIHSNLSGQRPPMDLDLENSMISVASIKSEIYELSSTASFTNEIFQSAVEDICSPVAERITADNSIGGNTYTIFPPENMNAENGKSTDIVSEGGNTVVSDDFTDAEEIEDFETAPADDNIDHIVQPEKGDVEKSVTTVNPGEIDNDADLENIDEEICLEKTTPPSNLTFQQHQANQQKPLMEVHPLESGNKYSTFKVSRSPMSPRSSPKQKRRDDPERYKTRTIAALHAGRSLLQSNDSNGNPLDSDTRFATFRVGGPKIARPIPNVNSNTSSVKSSQSNSPESTPGNSPKGIRGRRKPLYSSLPPSAVIKKRVAPPVPPKPVRNASPVRPPSGGGGVYVRPTRTSELRIAANSRDSSPGRVVASSRTSSSSSINMSHTNLPLKQADNDNVVSSRPKVAPKPPVRTTPSVSSASNIKPFSGSTVLIKTSNSSFGFGQPKVADGSFAQNMKGYSTLPKSSKLGGDFAGMYLPGSVPNSRNAESKESIPGSEKSQGKIGKLTNLFKKMDFHRNSKETQDTSQHVENKQCNVLGISAVEKKSSKFSNFFGRKKEKTQPKPFLESNGGSNANMGPDNNASIRGPSGIWIRRDGEIKAMVAPFNYVPPPGHSITNVSQHKDQNSVLSSNNSNANVVGESTLQASSSSAAGSAKITTV